MTRRQLALFWDCEQARENDRAALMVLAISGALGNPKKTIQELQRG